MFGVRLTFDEYGNLFCNHEFEEYRQEPTCTESGYVQRHCIHCGDGSSEEIPPFGHFYVNGICQNCGQSEGIEVPPYDEIEQVRKQLLNDMDNEWNWLINEVGDKVVGMYWPQYNELVNRMYSVYDLDMLYNIYYNEFRWLLDEVRRNAHMNNQDHFVQAYLEQRRFEITEGHGYDLERFIEENIIGKNLYVEYSQSGIVAIPITWDMIDWDMNVDISSPGEYEVGVRYDGRDFGTWQNVRIVVWMDMSDADYLGTYSCYMSSMGEDDIMIMDIYDNGYAYVYFNWDSEYRDLLPCEINGNLIYMDTMGDGIYVMEIDGAGTAHMYKAPEDEPIIGIYKYEDEIEVTVYGKYSGMGRYIAKIAIIEDGEVFWVASLVELNLEDRFIICEMLGRDAIYFDENGNLLDEDSDEDMNGDSDNWGEVEQEIPLPSTPDYDVDDSYGEVVIVPGGSTGNGEIVFVPGSNGMNGGYTYNDAVLNGGNAVYVPVVNGDAMYVPVVNGDGANTVYYVYNVA